jgi:hypothetical protein
MEVNLCKFCPVFLLLFANTIGRDSLCIFELGFRQYVLRMWLKYSHVNVSHAMQADWKAAEKSSDVQVHRNLYLHCLPSSISKSHYAICSFAKVVFQ